MLPASASVLFSAVRNYPLAVAHDGIGGRRKAPASISMSLFRRSRGGVHCHMFGKVLAELQALASLDSDSRHALVKDDAARVFLFQMSRARYSGKRRAAYPRHRR